MSSRRVGAFVEALRRNRRPRRFRARPEDAELMRAAIELSRGRPGATQPSADFVNELHHRLTEQLDSDDLATPVRGHAPISRRVAIGGIAAAAVAGAVIDREVLQRPSPQPLAHSQELVPDAGVWATVAAESALQPGDVMRFSTASTVGFVMNDGGRLSAISGVCTHQGYLLRHNDVEGRLDCPCHRASFSLQGDVVRQQFSQPIPSLPRIQVRSRDGRIEINDAMS